MTSYTTKGTNETIKGNNTTDSFHIQNKNHSSFMFSVVMNQFPISCSIIPSMVFVLLSGGDHVLIRPFGNIKQPYVGLVKKITLGTSDPEVTVAWFYRPTKTSYASVEFIGKRELFYSSEIEKHSAETTISKCVVHTFIDYCNLTTIGPTDFYCRYRYDPVTGKIDAGRDKVAV